MKYLSQFLIIMGFTLAGEALQLIVPLPIPASVYGLSLLFLALCLRLVKVEQVKQTGAFLTSILPLLFVPSVVGIAQDWNVIRPQILSICLLILATTAVTFGISGKLAQALKKRKEGKDHE